MTSQTIFGSSNLNIESTQSTPRSIQDIVQLIDNTKIDEKVIEASLKLVNLSLPSNSSKSQSYAFYYQQSLAAEKLGMSYKRLKSLEAALNFVDLGSTQEFY